MKRAAILAACFLLLLPALAISAATGGSEVATPSPDALADIPEGYLALYEQAALAYGIPWELLAGVGKVECDHGRSPERSCFEEGIENRAGAGGPMQFLASTWATYGLDGDGDGRADRWDPADAVYSAASFLAASGAADDPVGAVFAYNHSQAYVADVLAFAARYRAADLSAVPSGAAPLELGDLPPLGDRGALAQAVLSSRNISLRPEAVADLRAGLVDPRVLAVLLALSRRFSLGEVGPFVSGHSYYVAGTSRPSNHAFGRAVDIAAVDGSPVSAANASARAAALALASLPAPLRPDEVGSPFAELDGLPGFFSDQGHAGHLHLGFDA